MQNSTESDKRGSSYKTIQRALLLIVLIFSISRSLHADGPVKIILKPPPPEHLGVGDLWNLELNNTTDKPVKIYLTGSAKEQKDGLIIEGKTKPFTLKPGKTSYKYKDFPGAEIKYNNNKYKEILLRTGNAPEGSYTICVCAFTESGEIAGQENCIEQIVNIKKSVEFVLTEPEDNQVFTVGDNHIIVWPRFQWLLSPQNPRAKYTLRIVEMLKGQKTEAAMKENPAFFEENDIKGSLFQYPTVAPKFEEGRKYAWQISTENAYSDIRIFSLKREENSNDTASSIIELISPIRGNQSNDSHPQFIFRVLENKEIESFNLKIYELTPEKENSNFDSPKIFFQVKGLKQQSWKYPPEAPPVDTAKFYAWQVEAIGKNNVVVGTSAIGPFGSLGTSCSCYDPYIPPYQGIPTITICQNQSSADMDAAFKSGIGHFFYNIFNCTGPVSYSWSPLSYPIIPGGPYPYTCTIKKGTTTCTRAFSVYMLSSDLDVDICSPTGNTYKQCCGNKNFKIKLKTNNSCTAIISSHFPAYTTYQWYIMKKSGAAPSNPTGTIGTYSLGNVCWDNIPITVNVGTWYRFGGYGTSNIGNPGFTDQDFPVNGYTPPASLEVTNPGEYYYVTCFVNFPAGSFNCMNSGFTSLFKFSVSGPKTILATISTTPQNCGVNGTITVSGVSGGTGQYSVQVQSVTSGFVPIPNSTGTLTIPVPPSSGLNAGSYYVRIKDGDGCVKTFYPISVNQGTRPTVPTITGLTTLPCNGSINLTATPVSGFLYQWFTCSGTSLGAPSTSNISPNISTPDCYEVTITDPTTHACNTSTIPFNVTTLFPVAVISGSNDLCGGTGTLTATGTNLQWYLGTSTTPFATGSSVTITSTGSYTVTSTVIINGVSCTTKSTIPHNVNPCGCLCGSWNTVTVEQVGKPPKTEPVVNHRANFIQWGVFSSSLLMTVTPDYICNPPNCAATYRWRTWGVGGASGWHTGPISQLFTGVQGFTIEPTCGTHVCDTVFVNIVTQ